MLYAFFSHFPDAEVLPQQLPAFSSTFHLKTERLKGRGNTPSFRVCVLV